MRVMAHKADVYGLQFNEEKIVSCARDSLVRIWDMQTGTCISELKGHNLCLRTVSFDRNFIMSAGEDKTARGTVTFALVLWLTGNILQCGMSAARIVLSHWRVTKMD